MTTTSPIGSATASSISSSASQSGSTTNAASGLTQNFNTFLTLLTTQLQNQDPLSPLDTNQFTQQLVSFSQVEQQINTNSNLQQLISLQSAGESISALPLVGQQIEYNSPTASLASGGTANYVYNLPSNAATTQLTITDASGRQIYAASLGATAAGSHVFNWNGQTTAGVQVPAGDYTLSISAKDTSGSAITASVASVGTVSAVGVQNNSANFTIGDMSVPLSELVTVNPTLTQTN
ncbi:MAG TPA: flagellar hook capping FlgD N-terminal domain-containing protein [Stellaceae bacterium]|jgi:flagellar basal-body rod modification protein FlgD|nr:flagellar hook capping FlgD N-terminal domain-containing protein [Stellaceae bacterium]